MKPYMAYSNELGSAEGAILVFAHNLKEAKRIGYGGLTGIGITDEFTDMRVNLIKNGNFLFEQVPQWSKDKLAKDEPHILDSPPCCKRCELWGYELNKDGLCSDCEEISEDLSEALK